MARIAPHYCLSKLRLLQACLFSVSSRKKHIVVQQFMVAIALAQLNGSFCDEAVACEQYGRYLLGDNGDSDSRSEGLAQLRRACAVFRRWSANRKAEMLENELNQELGDSMTTKISTEPVQLENS
eukprot:CAMPEP_0116575180 /NCGR_PEP_ID=MMETSP0397-20121206/19813_1 /TAXON_ID=216820 /ORGANISM="Cyclophora tenuis, Strain ECT3854" /LENGTH=124 /DNA_ID=CAMNT_0004104041 /DNA_START=3 /DNA_END=374 /DNA_ORIENTATION=-